GDADRIGQGLGRDPKIGGDLRVRHDAQFRPVELRRRDRVFDYGNRPHLARDLVGGVVDDGDVGARDDELQVALAVVLEEPEANVRLIGEKRANPQLHVLLRRFALRLVNEIDDDRRLARLVVRASHELAAENERRANLGHGAQFVGDRAGDAIGVFEPRSWRQLDRQQRAAVIVRRDEPGRQQLRRPQRSGENQGAGEQGYPAVAHGSAYEPGVE